MARDITINAIKRLPIYYVIFEDLYARGVHRVSSSELSAYTKFTSSQIRADLNTFGAEGRQGYGYHVETIYMDLKGVLGLDYKKNLILKLFIVSKNKKISKNWKKLKKKQRPENYNIYS